MSTKQKKPVKAGEFVNTSYVDAVLREYKKSRWIQNSERIGKPDSLSVWISMEIIEEFLNLSKMHGGDGVKFYFSAYPEDYTAKPEYAGRQSLVMVATKSKQTEFGTTVNKDMYITRNGESTILAVDKLPMCPPFCGGSNEGGMGDLGITIVDKGPNGMELI